MIINNRAFYTFVIFITFRIFVNNNKYRNHNFDFINYFVVFSKYIQYLFVKINYYILCIVTYQFYIISKRTFLIFLIYKRLISRQDDKHSFCKIFIFVTYYMFLYLNNKQSMLLPNIFYNTKITRKLILKVTKENYDTIFDLRSILNFH